MAAPAADLDRGIPADVLARARRRVRRLRGFYMHASVYLIVMTAMIAMNLITSRQRIWFPFPMLGWGFGLAVHGLMTFGIGRWLGADWEERKVAEILARERIRTLSTDKQLAEARLRLLQAQIEPHFLFNTLANIRSLVRKSGSAGATAMLDNLITYLRAAVPALDAERSTFANEQQTVCAYLELMRVRMPDRLRYAVRIDPSALTLYCPPMALLTLVENAVKHGIDPSETGGTIDVRVELRERRVQVRVADTGVGLLARRPGGFGTGLTNLRERLALAFDGDAQFRLAPAHPHGTVAEAEFPASSSDAT